MSDTINNINTIKRNDFYVSKKRKRFILDSTLYIFLIINALIVLMPLVFMIVTSFKTLAEVLGPLTWIPKKFTLNNFKEVFELDTFYYFRFFFNTVFLFVIKAIGTILTCSFAAYGFVRFKYKYKSLIFGILLSVLMLPGELLNIPIYEMFINFGWYDTYYPFFIGCYLATDIFVLFLFRQFFITLPGDLFEAAKIDGASEFKIYRSIVLPLSVPVMVTTGILYFTGTYNDIYTPMLYLSSEEKFTMAQGIRLIETVFNNGSHDYIIPWNLVSAATLLGILPILFIFFAAQKQFIEGVATTGIKG